MIPHLLEVDRALMAVAAVLAVLLAVRVRAHRPFAVFIGAQTLVMLGRWALKSMLLIPAVAAAGGDLETGIAPVTMLHGGALVAGIAYNALWLSWAAGLSGLALWSFRAPWPEFRYDPTEEPIIVWLPREPRSWIVDRFWRLAGPTAFWLVAVGFIVVTYPEGRPFYPKLFAGATLASVLVGLGAFVSWQARGWRKRAPDFSQACIVGLLVCDAVSLAGPSVKGLFSTWFLSQSVDLVEYSALILAQGGFLWVTRSR